MNLNYSRCFTGISVITPCKHFPNCMLKITVLWGKIVSGKSRWNLWNILIKAPTERITTLINTWAQFTLNRLSTQHHNQLIICSFKLPPYFLLADVSLWRHVFLIETSFIQIKNQILCFNTGGNISLASLLVLLASSDTLTHWKKCSHSWGH